VTGAALVDIAKLKAETAPDLPAGHGSHQPSSGEPRVGYFNVANISAGLFGMPESAS
jgi:cation/acetate symporter